MKKIFALLLVTAMVLAVAVSCTKPEDNPEPTATQIDLGGETEKPADPTAVVTEKPADPTPAPTEEPNKAKVISIGAYSISDVNKGLATCEWMFDGEEAPETNYERWDSFTSDSELEHYVIIDLKKGYNLTSGEICFEFCNNYYKIFVSPTGQDDTWTEIYDAYADSPDMGANQIHEFSLKGSGRFVKLLTCCPADAVEELTASDHHYFSIYEFYILGTEDTTYVDNGDCIDIAPAATEAPTEAPDGTEAPATPTPKPIPGPSNETNLSTGKTATANFEEGDHVASRAVDGDGSTRWSGYAASDARENMALTVDLGAVYQIYDNEINFEYVATYYRVFVSETGEEGSFVPVYSSYFDEQSFGGGQTHEFTLSGVKARYVKIESYIPDKNDDAYKAAIGSTSGHRYFGIFEWNIFGV